MRTRTGSNFQGALFMGTILLLIVVFPATLLAESVNLPKTGQAKCYHQDGYEIDCADTRQDGDIQAGVAWPDPRFTDNGDGTLTDHLTGLMWLKDAECVGQNVNWQTALDNVAAFNQDPAGANCYQYNYQALSYADWRLPNINELESLVHAGMPDQAAWLASGGFYNVLQNDWAAYLWSSTTKINAPHSAWILSVSNGSIITYAKTNGGDGYFHPCVLVVRSAE